jgi:hypothetical protein
MTRRARSVVRGLLLAAPLAAASAPATGAPQCNTGPAGGSVAIVVVASPARVQQYAATVNGVPVLRREADTVIFADGRVVTANVGAVDRHLNALGWADRRIEILASFSKRSPRRVPG